MIDNYNTWLSLIFELKAMYYKSFVVNYKKEEGKDKNEKI